MKESLKALVLLQWVPMALQFMVGDSKGGTEVAMQAGGMAVYAQMAKTYLWWAFGLVGVLFVVCFVAAARTRTGASLAGQPRASFKR